MIRIQAIVMVLIVILGGGALIHSHLDRDPVVAEDQPPAVSFDSARAFCWHSFGNTSGMSVECLVAPTDGTHLVVEYAMVSDDSWISIDGVESTGFGSTGWFTLGPDPVVIRASGADSFPDDDRADFFVVRVVPHPE